MSRNPWPSIAALVVVSVPAGLLAAFVRLPHTNAQDAAAPQRMIVVTVDDLPGAEPGTDHAVSNLRELERINRAIPAVLKAHHVPAVGFVIEWKLQVDGERDARARLLQDWLDAGMTLGNHTYTHPDFQTTPLGQYEDDTIRGEAVTRAMMSARGMTEKYFRHPFLNTGPTAEAKAAFEAFLKERGYEVAPVTIDSQDWMFNDALALANAKKDKKRAAKIREEYLAYADVAFDYFEAMARQVFGRDIPHILLTHDSELNAEVFDQYLTKIEKRGYKFVSLEEALADPAYATPDKYVGPEGISWLNRWKISFGQDPDFQHNPDPPKWVIELSAEIRKAHKK
jgi:peptidoglycan/xylan/chitin deacetylase (PgdA/CDA1 family)